MSSRRKLSNDEDEETGLLQRNSKPSRRAEMELLQLRNMERFISKFYWLLILAFLAVGVMMIIVLIDRSFSDVFMAEQLMSTINYRICYIILVIVDVPFTSRNANYYSVVSMFFHRMCYGILIRIKYFGRVYKNYK